MARNMQHMQQKYKVVPLFTLKSYRTKQDMVEELQ